LLRKVAELREQSEVVPFNPKLGDLAFVKTKNAWKLAFDSALSIV
jgi:hypothetical protein